MKPINLEEVAIGWCDENGYSFVSEIGGGAFKRVFLVRNNDDVPIALKIVQEPVASPRAEREVEAIRRCSHPNISQLYGVGKHDHRGNTYDVILEEYLSGGTLTQRYESEGLFSEEAVHSIGACLIDCLEYLRSLSLVHRDIKPDNVMFREDGSTPVLVDFGLVRDLEATSLTHTWAGRGPGTPFYSAPEQLNNQKHLIDWRTDQFSLGVMLAQLRYGIHPYQEDGEPLYSIATVERVAKRGAHSKRFINMASSSNRCLLTMTKVWPVERYRTPSDLINSWNQI